DITQSKSMLPVGAVSRVRVMARDVSLTLTHTDQTSISNILPAHIVGITEDRDPAKLLVQLDLAGSRLLSRITRRSAASLGIGVGMEVFAQVKSVALMA